MLTVAKNADRATRPGILTGPLRAVTLGVVISVTLFAFEALAVATVLPSAARDLHGLANFGWAFTAFLLANVLGMVLSGGISDRSGPRLPLIVGVSGFGAGLLAAGLAPTMAMLVAGRALQGFSGGMLITALYVLIGQFYPEPLQPKLVVAMSAAWVLPSLIGPVLAGTLAQQFGWRWAFLGLTPAAVLAAVLLIPTLRQLGPVTGGRRPPLRARMVAALAVAAGVGALQRAGQWLSMWAILLAMAGLITVVWAMAGLLPRGAWRVAPGVAGPVALRGLLAGAFFGVEALLPLSLQDQHGLSPLAAGVPLTFGSVSWAIGSWVQGRDRWTDRARSRLISAGFSCIAIAALGIALVARPATPLWLVFPFWALAGLGAGLGISSVSVLLLRFTTDDERGQDSASLQLADAVGAALTAGFGGVMVALAVRGALPAAVSFAVVDIAMGGLALTGAIAATRVRAVHS